MGALVTSGVASVSTSGANPELFGFAPVDSIVSPIDADGEVSWSTADMIIGKGWLPTVYNEEVVEALFGEPKRLAPDVRGWAFAHEAHPEMGLLLQPSGDGAVQAKWWEWGNVPLARRGQGLRACTRAGSAWLNALAAFQREVLQSHEGQ